MRSGSPSNRLSSTNLSEVCPSQYIFCLDCAFIICLCSLSSVDIVRGLDFSFSGRNNSARVLLNGAPTMSDFKRNTNWLLMLFAFLQEIQTRQKYQLILCQNT